MCRKYEVKGKYLTLEQVKARLADKKYLPPKVVYSKQEIVSASKVLDRLKIKLDTLSKPKKLI